MGRGLQRDGKCMDVQIRGRKGVWQARVVGLERDIWRGRGDKVDKYKLYHLSLGWQQPAP